jgi:hypothetical protein
VKHTTRLLLGALCVAVLAYLGVSKFGQRDNPIAKPTPSIRHAKPESSLPPAAPESTQQVSAPSVHESTGLPAISAFRQWADVGASPGFSEADQIKGLALAKARAAAMKTLIQQDPVTALSLALPSDVRNSLPPQIAAAIEQPVRRTGMCAMRLECNHAFGAPLEEAHQCHSVPILNGGSDSWNAYYGDPQWETLVGQPVEFEGIAVETELAVGKIAPAPLPSAP